MSSTRAIGCLLANAQAPYSSLSSLPTMASACSQYLLLASLRAAIGFPKMVCPFPYAVLALWCILLWIIGHDSAPGSGRRSALRGILKLRRSFRLICRRVHRGMPLLGARIPSHGNIRRIDRHVMVSHAEEAADSQDVCVHIGPGIGDIFDRTDILLRSVVDIQPDDLRRKSVGRWYFGKHGARAGAGSSRTLINHLGQRVRGDHHRYWIAGLVLRLHQE